MMTQVHWIEPICIDFLTKKTLNAKKRILRQQPVQPSEKVPPFLKANQSFKRPISMCKRPTGTENEPTHVQTYTIRAHALCANKRFHTTGAFGHRSILVFRGLRHGWRVISTTQNHVLYWWPWRVDTQVSRQVITKKCWPSSQQLYHRNFLIWSTHSSIRLELFPWGYRTSILNNLNSDFWAAETWLRES